jgi:MFS family permease
MRLNVAAGVLGMLWMVVPLGLPLPLLLRAVDASGLQLGLMSSAWQLSMLAQVPSALIVERLARRKPFWASISIVHRLLWCVPALLPWLLPHRRDLWPTVIILALALSNTLGQSGTAPWQSWMADLLPPHRAGRFWGARHRWLSVSLITGALLYGYLLDRFSHGSGEFLGFQIVFALAALFGTADILLHCGVAEPKQVRHSGQGDIWHRVIAPLREPDFRRLTIAMGFWVGGQAMLGYTMGLPSFFSMVYLKEVFGATYGQASWVFVASALGAVLWTARAGHWIDLAGGRKVMLFLTAWGPVGMFAWLLVTPARFAFPGLSGPGIPQPVILLAAVALLSGGIYSASWMCQVRLTQALTNPAGRTLAMGVHWCSVGLIGSFGALGAGLLKDHWPRDWTWHLFPGAAPWSYFQTLVVLHAVIAWLVVRPLIRRISA